MTNESLFKILHYLPKVCKEPYEVSPRGLCWAESSWVQDTSSFSTSYSSHPGPLGTPGFSRYYILLPAKMVRTEPVAPGCQSPELCNSPWSVCCPKCSDSWPWWCWILLSRSPSCWLCLAEKAPNVCSLVMHIQTRKYFSSLPYIPSVYLAFLNLFLHQIDWLLQWV